MVSETAGYTTSSASEPALTKLRAATSCEKAVKDALDSEGIGFDSLTVNVGQISELDITAGLFQGQLEAKMFNDEFAGGFDFTCLTDGIDAQVADFYFPPENFKVPQTSAQAAPQPSAQPQPQQQQPQQPPVAQVDPQRIDPQNNGAGRVGRDDNLGIYYHNRVDWQFLQKPGAVVPGGAILNATQSTRCSTGFIASTGNRAFIVTAGHCGDVGDQFYIQDAQGGNMMIGEMVESYVERSGNSIAGADIGLIEIYDDAKPYVDSALPMDQQLKGWITPEEAQRRNMGICRLGSTTGYSCGVFVSVEPAGQFYFRNISDRGDSGGAIFAYDDSGVWALGVMSRGSDHNPTLAGGMEIAGAMQYWGLTLHG